MTRAEEHTTRLTSLADLGAVFGIEAGEELDASPTVPPDDSSSGPIVSAELGPCFRWEHSSVQASPRAHSSLRGHGLGHSFSVHCRCS